VQPDGISISGNELVDGQTIDHRRARDPLLPAINEDRHVLFFSLAARSPFGGSQPAFLFGHANVSLVRIPASALCGIDTAPN
jgi:hypothetical protein